MILELERMRARHGICGKDHSPSRLDAFVKSLEEERNYYKQEVERYRLVRGRTDKTLTPSPGRGRSPRGRGSWHEKVGADNYFCNYNVAHDWVKPCWETDCFCISREMVM